MICFEAFSNEYGKNHENMNMKNSNKIAKGSQVLPIEDQLGFVKNFLSHVEAQPLLLI